MWKKALPGALVGLGLCAAAGLAAANGTIVQRGYVTCVDDLESAYPRQARVLHARYYHHERSVDDMTYYVNSTAWQDGDRVRLRTRCRTDTFGRDLLARDTAFGRWVEGRTRVRIEEVPGR